MDAPTPEEVRQRSALLDREFPESEEDDEALARWIAAAVQIVSSLTCRAIGPDAEGEEVPDGKRELALTAVTLKVEQMVMRRGSAKSSSRRIGTGNLQSIHAGPWGETYFGPGEAAKSKVLDLDPSTNEALWALATEECRADWLALWSGEFAPAAAVAAFEWGARPGGI